MEVCGKWFLLFSRTRVVDGSRIREEEKIPLPKALTEDEAIAEAEKKAKEVLAASEAVEAVQSRWIHPPTNPSLDRPDDFRVAFESPLVIPH